MNELLNTLPRASQPTKPKTVLSKDGFHCSIITLASGEATPRGESGEINEHILFVVDGKATVHFDDVNTILSEDEALLIPKGREHVITASAGRSAKLLRVDIPPRQVVTPQILSFDR